MTDLARALGLVEFLQDVALGERKATEAQVAKASAELDELLPDLPPSEA